jgi:type IV secretion system protein VirB8
MVILCPIRRGGLHYGFHRLHQAVLRGSPNVAQVRFLKTPRKTKQEAVTQPFVATVEFAFAPKTERSLAHVWENPLGFTVSSYRVDAETLESNP